MKEAAQLYVMVQDDARIWRLVGYTNKNLRLILRWGVVEVTKPKTRCRVGEAQDWRTSRFAAEWDLAGGNE
jgi:hypothetical protein